ncbi:anthranilate synthase component I family protein [Algoriphagus aestuarii]|nr:anthranilate synthase component I family protein [Algoriphagus aestuarii]
MMDFPYAYPVPFPDFKQKLSKWAKANFQFLALFQGNNYQYPEEPFSDFFFAGNQKLTESEIWDKSVKKVKIGIIGYDFKNQIEKLSSSNPPCIPLPELCFFTPEIAIRFEANLIKSTTELPEKFWNEVESVEYLSQNTECNTRPLISKQEYLDAVKKIQGMIVEGDTYEMNFCQAFEGQFEDWDPVSAYFELQKASPMPFSALFKAEDKWLISASPERYLKKTDSRLIGQPIKGTIRRGNTPKEDQINHSILIESEKERAENLMITDLTRNDLSKVSKVGTVRVDELFGIYSLPRVFQMITTVSSQLKENTSFMDIIHATFPMGSMTGAPKIRTMELIEQLETFRRGWFSGAFGWIDEDGDFDFSVIIRSIIADLNAKKLYFAVGSAITIDSDASKEYEECELKSLAIREILHGRRNT